MFTFKFERGPGGPPGQHQRSLCRPDQPLYIMYVTRIAVSFNINDLRRINGIDGCLCRVEIRFWDVIWGSLDVDQPWILAGWAWA